MWELCWGQFCLIFINDLNEEIEWTVSHFKISQSWAELLIC